MNVPFKDKTSVTMLGIGTSIGIPFKDTTINWSSYWNRIKPDMAFLSSTFDYTNNQWTDQSGNDNHVSVLAPYYASNGGWGLEVTSWLTDYGFSTYHEFKYDSSNYQIIWSIGASASSDKQMSLLTDNTNNRLKLFNRVANVSVYGNTGALTNGQTYKLLVNWISKDSIKVYINSSAIADLNANAVNWTWQATWNRIQVGAWRSAAATYAYSQVGIIKETRVLSGTATWANIGSNITAHYYHNYDNNVTRDWDLSGNNRHLSLVNTNPTTKTYLAGVSPQLKNGYQICKRVSYGGTNYDPIYVPYDNNGASLIVTTNYPWRIAQDLPTRDSEWVLAESIAAATSKYNGCDVKFAFPYNVMMAASDSVLGALFTGTTPNQLDPYTLWDDHLEKHILFFNKGVVSTTSTGWQRWNNKTCDKQLLEIDELAVFKAERTDHVNILKYLGYSSAPATITGGEIYRMVTANDSFKLSSTHLTASKFAGLWDLFYEKDISNSPLKCRYQDVEKINGRNIFCNGTDTLWIYPKPLLPSHFEAALNSHLGITGIENIITTADGVNYYDIDYEKYTVTKNGAINLNPNATVDAKYDIFDRRNVVGSAKEIWDAAMVLGSAYWTWNLSSGTKKLYQPSVAKYIQAAYSGKLFIRQDWDNKNNLICPYIISFATPLTGAAKTAMFEFIDFPETVNEPAIVGDGVTDDALAINIAMGTNSAVMLYEKTAKTQTEIKIPSDVELILADTTVISNNDINLNIIRNSDFTGDDNIKLSGYGVSIIDGNGANQDRDAYLPITNSYKFIPILFATVDTLEIRGFECKDPAFWGVNIQMSDNVIAEHIRFNHAGGQHNQDGLGFEFGTRYSIARYLTGTTNDDLTPVLNYDNTAAANIEVVVNGARRIQYNYYRNIRWDGAVTTESLGTQCIRLYDNQNYGISNIEWQNVYAYKNSKTGFGETLSIILFSDVSATYRSDAGTSFGYVFNNIRGSATRNIRFLSGNYSEIDINNFMVDDPNETTEKHIWVQDGILTNVDIQSVITYSPTTVYDYDGGTLTNFTHTET